jgi:hypothetical protein
MARGPNKNDTTKVQPTISAQTSRYLDRLVEIGAYGNTPTAVAAYLIQREIDDLIRSGVLRPITKKTRR